MITTLPVIDLDSHPVTHNVMCNCLAVGALCKGPPDIIGSNENSSIAPNLLFILCPAKKSNFTAKTNHLKKFLFNQHLLFSVYLFFYWYIKFIY
jgi:hypothetical protein